MQQVVVGKENTSLTNIESLPDELVFQILLELPAEDIYDSTMLVCKKWYKIINSRYFIHEHLHHSAPGLVIQTHSNDENAIYMEMRRGRIEISKSSHLLRVLVRGSCNGLIVEYLNSSLYIENPATNQRFILPPCLHPKLPSCSCGIAYSSASMKYKAVISQYCDYEGKDCCAILTVGVDKSWRYVDTKHLSRRSTQLFGRVPMATEGFLHWTDRKGPHVVTMNVETEIFTENPINPQGCGKRLRHYLSIGSSITLLIECNDFSWEFWKMKSENGEWTKLPNIDLEPPKYKFEYLVGGSLCPVGWLSEEVLVFSALMYAVCILYNARTQEIELCEYDCDSDCDSDYCWFNVHRNSLVSPDGC